MHRFRRAFAAIAQSPSSSATSNITGVVVGFQRRTFVTNRSTFVHRQNYNAYSRLSGNRGTPDQLTVPRRTYHVFDSVVEVMGGLSSTQMKQLNDLCHCLLSAQRNKTPLEELKDERYCPDNSTQLPDSFPILNVSSVRTPRAIYRSHFADSLALIPTIDALAAMNVNEKKIRLRNNAQSHDGADDVQSAKLRILDLGTGGGLPGLVLAIARPEWNLTLVDSVKRKCLFIEEVVKALGLDNVHVVSERGEALSSLRQARREIGKRIAEDQLNASGLGNHGMEGLVGPYLTAPPKGYISANLLQSAIKAAAANAPNPLPKPTSYDTPNYHPPALDDISERAPFMYAQDPHLRESYDFVVSRAMANPAVLMELGMPLLKPRGHLIMMKYVERPKKGVSIEASKSSQNEKEGSLVATKKGGSDGITEDPLQYDPVPRMWGELNSSNHDLTYVNRMASLVGGSRSPKYVDYTDLVPIEMDESKSSQRTQTDSEDDVQSAEFESNSQKSSKSRVLAVVRKKFYTPLCYPREGEALGSVPSQVNKPKAKLGPSHGEGVPLARPFTASIVHRVAEQMIRTQMWSSEVMRSDSGNTNSESILSPEMFADLTDFDVPTDNKAQNSTAIARAQHKANQAHAAEQNRRQKEENRQRSEARAKAWRVSALRAADAAQNMSENTSGYQSTTYHDDIIGVRVDVRSNPVAAALAARASQSSQRSQTSKDQLKVTSSQEKDVSPLQAETLRERLDREQREMRNLRRTTEREWSVAYRSLGSSDSNLSPSAKQSRHLPTSNSNFDMNGGASSAADVGLAEVRKWEAFIKQERKKEQTVSQTEAQSGSNDVASPHPMIEDLFRDRAGEARTSH